MAGRGIPRVNVVGARGDDRREHMCSACMNPFTKNGNPECRNAVKPRAEVPASFPESEWGDELEDIDGVDRDTDAWLEAADNYREAEMDRQRGWA